MDKIGELKVEFFAEPGELGIRIRHNENIVTDRTSTVEFKNPGEGKSIMCRVFDGLLFEALEKAGE